MKILNSKIHGLIDYLFVVFLWASPTIFSLPEETSLFTYILGTIHLIVTITTNFELGIIKIIPFKIHGYIELIVSFALVGLAFYLGAVENEFCRNFYLFLAILVFLTWLLSDYSTSTKSDLS